MGTHAHIGIKNADGSIEAVFCHWDGSPEFVGRILRDSYTAEEKVRQLIAFGKRYNDAKNYQDQMAQSHSAKYKILNIKHLANGGKGTVEFRCFSGSLNVTKIVGWVQVCLGIVEKALTCKRLPSWNGKNPIGVWKKEGAGATECERLLAYLCWGNYGKYAAHQRAYGWVSNEINQKDIKEIFRNLAKKYDEQN